MLGLHCCEGLSLVAAGGGDPVEVGCGPRLAEAYLVVAHRLSCSAAVESALNQGWKPRPPPWQTDSQPRDHQGRPGSQIFFNHSLLILTLSSKTHTTFRV